MPITQSFSTPVDQKFIEQAQSAYAAVIQQGLPVLKLPEESHRVDELLPIAQRFREQFQTVVVLGTGGSSLGGQSLVALAQDQWGFQLSGPRLIFLDNIDPDTFTRFFKAVDFNTTGFIVISKSGNTAETLCQLYAILDLCAGAQVLVITEPKDSELTRVAQQYNFTTLAHDPNVGGRFAALSLVGLLPAMIAGLDAYKILKGAALNQEQAVLGSAWTMQTGKSLSVMMPYCDRLQLFCKWYRQLWAESLGKQGKGITPIAAYGTVDQHSQLQLYLDGPADKMFTIIATDHHGGCAPITAAGSLQGHTIGDLMQAEQQATIETITRRGAPVRIMHLPTVDEQAIGALMMHFMLETMVVARMMEINAFDQPAVEEGKILAKKYLAEAA